MLVYFGTLTLLMVPYCFLYFLLHGVPVLFISFWPSWSTSTHFDSSWEKNKWKSLCEICFPTKLKKYWLQLLCPSKLCSLYWVVKWMKRHFLASKEGISLYYYTINHKSANNISNIYLLPCTAVELYGVIAYLSQNASKNRKWILSLYTVLTLLLSFPNFGLLSLGLGLYFYLFLLMDVGGCHRQRFLVTFGLDCLILNNTYIHTDRNKKQKTDRCLPVAKMIDVFDVDMIMSTITASFMYDDREELIRILGVWPIVLSETQNILILCFKVVVILVLHLEFCF